MPNLNEEPKRVLARRDYVLLPAICVLTVVLMFVVSEMGTRLVWPAAREGKDCHREDAALGMVNVPNCTMRIKVPETSWITYHYNECGFRSTEACGPKPPGTRRVAVLGTSFAEGTSVAYGDSFGALSAARLTRACHGPVEFQNLGVYDLPLRKVLTRIDQTIALQPDATVLVVAPFDLEKLNLPDDAPAGLTKVAATAAPGTAGAPAASRPDLLTRVKEMVQDSRAITVAEHFMFENPDIQIPMYLHYGDKADFLRPPFSPAWQHRLAVFDQLIGDTAQRLRAAGVPLVLVVIPQRTQAELLAMKHRPPGIDPFALERAMRAISQKHGVQYVDLFTEFSHETHPAHFYYPVDNHLNEDGSRAVARGIVAGLANGGIAAFNGCEPESAAKDAS
jgi:hypothetical protein